jgi:acetate kinase
MTSEFIPILTVNGGSSSIKFAVYRMGGTIEKQISGAVNGIGGSLTELGWTSGDGKQGVSREEKIPVEAKDFQEAAAFLAGWLSRQPASAGIQAIGHRIVHGMDRSAPAPLDDGLLQQLKSIQSYDPDHLPAEISLVQQFGAAFPGRLQVACFDTAFHAHLPRVARILPIPRRFERAGVRRYGFHGLSYAYLMEVLHEKVGSAANGRVILAHLGSGASLAAVKAGECIDTSMGFTPVGGIPMSTRTGDLDPGVAWWIIQNEQMTPDQFSHLINRESGLLGVSETSADMQELLALESNDSRAAEAIQLFCYQVKKWIGGFVAALGGLDLLVFSGGIGEHAPLIRSRICSGMEYAGIRLDESRNRQNAFQIAADPIGVQVLVIPTDEERMIARSTWEIYQQVGLGKLK